MTEAKRAPSAGRGGSQFDERVVSALLQVLGGRQARASAGRESGEVVRPAALNGCRGAPEGCLDRPPVGLGVRGPAPAPRTPRPRARTPVGEKTVPPSTHASREGGGRRRRPSAGGARSPRACVAPGPRGGSRRPTEPRHLDVATEGRKGNERWERTGLLAPSTTCVLVARRPEQRLARAGDRRRAPFQRAGREHVDLAASEEAGEVSPSRGSRPAARGGPMAARVSTSGRGCITTATSPGTCSNRLELRANVSRSSSTLCAGLGVARLVARDETTGWRSRPSSAEHRHGV